MCLGLLLSFDGVTSLGLFITKHETLYKLSEISIICLDTTKNLTGQIASHLIQPDTLE